MICAWKSMDKNYILTFSEEIVKAAIKTRVYILNTALKKTLYSN